MIDIPAGKLEAKLSQKEINSLLAKLPEFQSPVKSGYLRRYADKVSSASTGAVFE
jgi:dihydroxy-acid dehydratase